MTFPEKCTHFAYVEVSPENCQSCCASFSQGEIREALKDRELERLRAALQKAEERAEKAERRHAEAVAYMHAVDFMDREGTERKLNVYRSEIEALRADRDSHRREWEKLTGGLMDLYPADMNGDAGCLEGIRAALAEREAELKQAKEDAATFFKEVDELVGKLDEREAEIERLKAEGWPRDGLHYAGLNHPTPVALISFLKTSLYELRGEPGRAAATARREALGEVQKILHSPGLTSVGAASVLIEALAASDEKGGVG